MLLFCLELRDKSVWKAKTLPELLRLAKLGLSAEEQEEVPLFITHHPNKVAIVCDGLDEGSVDESSFLWHLLQGNCVGVPSHLHVAVTTRPCIAASKLSQSLSYQGVEVVGFTKEDVALFARKYLGEVHSTKLLSCLDKQPSVAGMMHAPLFCLLVCDLFQEDQKLPSRKTEVLEKIVVALLHRYAKAKNIELSFDDVAHATAKLRKMILGLGKAAFQDLQKKQMYFTDVELDSAGVPAEALELGLLTKSESTNFWKRDECAFSHLTLQEFLAAVYVSCEVLQTDGDMARLLEKVSFTDGHLSTYWIFLAGLLQGKFAEVLLRSLSQSIGDHGRDMDFVRLLLYRCFAECHLGRSGSPSASVGNVLKRQQWPQSPLNSIWVPLSTSDCDSVCTVLRRRETLKM